MVWQTNNEQLTTKDFYVQNYFTEAVAYTVHGKILEG